MINPILVRSKQMKNVQPHIFLRRMALSDMSLSLHFAAGLNLFMIDLSLLLGLVGGLLSLSGWSSTAVISLDDVSASSEDVVNGSASSIASCQIPSGAGGCALERLSICLAIDEPLTMIRMQEVRM